MRLRTFGGLALTGDGERADVRLQRRQLALLAVLATEGAAGVTRDRLLGLFSSDRDPARARHTLDQMLYAVRRVIGAESLVSGPVALHLESTLLPSDVAEFSASLERGDTRAAADAYRGRFLEGVFLADAPEFERWAEGRRAYFADAFVRALIRSAAASTGAADYAEAVHLLRRAAAAEPLSGEVVHALMLALAHAGDQSAALSAARVHAMMVREQLDADPDAQIRALEAELRAGRVPAAPRAPGRGGTPPSTRPSGSGGTPFTASAAPTRRPTAWTLALIAGGALLLFAALAAAALWRSQRGFVLRDLTQLSATGMSRTPAISADGKYLAYATKECDSAPRCGYALEVQEIGGSATRRLIEHARSIDYLAWSGDARNLLLVGSIAGRAGTFRVSALDGPPEYLGPRFAAFFANGDSLFFLPAPASGTRAWLVVATLDGVAHDSVPIAGAGAGGEFDEVLSVPGSPWIVVAVRRRESEELRVIDRQGHEVGRRSDAAIAQNLRTSRDALWRSSPQGATNSVLVRIPFNAATGRLADREDTLYAGVFSEFDVTANGERLVVDQETTQFELRVVTLRDAVRGAFESQRPVVRSSTGIDAELSPDGATLLIARQVGSTPGGGWRYTIMPVGGGAERPLPLVGHPIGERWVAPAAFAIGEELGDSTRFVTIDAATGARGRAIMIREHGLRYFTPVPGGGWVWVAPDGQSIRVQDAGDPAPRLLSKPPWYQRVRDIMASPDGHRVAFWGLNATEDSMRITVVTLADGSMQTWWTRRAPTNALVDWFRDGALRVRTYEALDTLVFSRMRSPELVERLATISRATEWGAISSDLRRVMLITRSTRGDVWMSRVAAR